MLLAVICCQRLKVLDVSDSHGFTPQDVVQLLDELRLLYGGEPFKMSLCASSQLLRGAAAEAAARGWCYEGEGHGFLLLQW